MTQTIRPVLPNFLVIGAAKAATTAVCEHLDRHPEIYISPKKETFFFSRDSRYALGLAWYHQMFAGVTTEKAIGEGSTHYSAVGVFPEMLPRIATHLPDVKLIYMLRHPLTRIESMWMEHRSQGLERLGFFEAIREEPIYLETSRYWKQYDAYRAYYDADRFLLLFYEDFRRDPQAVLSRMFAFLGVDPLFVCESADQPIYASVGKREDRGITNVIRRGTPGFQRLRDRSPRWLRRSAKRWLKRPIEGRPAWDADSRAWAIGELKGDAARMLEHCGKPPDYWGAEFAAAGEKAR